MDNKLSELSKPVAQIYYDEHDSSVMRIGWLRGDEPKNPEPLYSQEYVSALLAERDAFEASALAMRDEWRARGERIAELERANQSQDDHINQQQDRIDSLEKTNAGLGRRLGDAEKRLATPVRLPRPACVYADHSYPAYSRKQVEEIITSAGMRFTVEGDE